jgi:hypothetical protein
MVQQVIHQARTGLDEMFTIIEQEQGPLIAEVIHNLGGER